MVAPPSEPEIREFKTDRAWERWLDRNHGKADGVWLKFAKKGTGVTTVDYAGALDVALCYGWIDGQTRRLDDTYYLQRFTPRRARSKWSKINREKVARLIEEDRMKPPGQAEIDRAKADGRWDAAYDPPSKIQPTPELLAALDANPRAKALFDELDRTNRYAILYGVQDAKRPQTKARRIEEFVAMLSEGRTPYPRAAGRRRSSEQQT